MLEKSSVVGGAAITEEFAPGLSNSVASYTVSLLNPKVIADLVLERYGLQIIERPASNFWPVDDQRGLLVPYCAAGRREAYAEFSAKDAARLDDYDAELGRAVSVLRRFSRTTRPWRHSHSTASSRSSIRGARRHPVPPTSCCTTVSAR